MEQLWQMPVPPSALLRSPGFAVLPRRECELRLQVESDDGSSRAITLRFTAVEAYRCTYMTSCSAEMFRLAYGKLVSLESTPWLSEIRAVGKKAKETADALKHLMITFDDGPCYEIVCQHCRIDE